MRDHSYISHENSISLRNYIPITPHFRIRRLYPERICLSPFIHSICFFTPMFPSSLFPRSHLIHSKSKRIERTYLVKIYDRFPELVLRLVEVSHADLSKVTGMVLVEIGPVVVLTTGHTATTGMLAVLANTTVTSGNMTAAKREVIKNRYDISDRKLKRFGDGGLSLIAVFDIHSKNGTGGQVLLGSSGRGIETTHLFLVFESRVGILSTMLDSTRLCGC